eukprot:TRINITY_DN8220_c0_g1_i1.p2 TRINITY_DN8220_c0_g1~~TRINITY_DN8220_c0_g1_i1.p2  ORF type:complete len:353 (+),score=71.93 TRINITY_DN8220_c0_g1_i1:1539-2597(+)
MKSKAEIVKGVFADCQKDIAGWKGLSVDDFEFDDPKGFSTFTMGVRAKDPEGIKPPAVLYRKLEGKENAILESAEEREIFLLLGKEKIAANCLSYTDEYRIEEFYVGRTLTADDLINDDDCLKGIANELYRFHNLKPTCLPKKSYFELLHEKWGAQAREILNSPKGTFPEREEQHCAGLLELCTPETLRKVKDCIPAGKLTFCHNDTYHGNIFKLADGTIKLLDFEFSCLNNKAFDFSNVFAETVMEHKLPEYPYFRIGKPRFDEARIAKLIGYYLDNETFSSDAARIAESARLVQNTMDMLILSDFMYAMAACTLALEPMQKIPFLTYGHIRFQRFLANYKTRCEKKRSNY